MEVDTDAPAVAADAAADIVVAVGAAAVGAADDDSMASDPAAAVADDATTAGGAAGPVDAQVMDVGPIEVPQDTRLLRGRPYAYCAHRVDLASINERVKQDLVGSRISFNRTSALALGSVLAGSAAPFDFERCYFAAVLANGSASTHGEALRSADGLIGLEEGATAGIYMTPSQEVWVVVLLVPPPKPFLHYCHEALRNIDDEEKARFAAQGDWYAVLARSAAYCTTVVMQMMFGVIPRTWSTHPDGCIKNGFDVLVVSSAPRASSEEEMDPWLDGTQAMETTTRIPIVAGNPLTGIRVRPQNVQHTSRPLFRLDNPRESAVQLQEIQNAHMAPVYRADDAGDARPVWMDSDGQPAVSVCGEDAGYETARLVVGIYGGVA